jgi:hypothetical protein
MDSGLKQDLAAATPSSLELAPQASQAQVTVSAIEAGPESAPKAAAPKRVTRPTTKPAPRLASHEQQATAPAPQPQIVEAQAAPAPAPQATTPAPAREPAPLAQPAHAQGRQPGVYSTEAQVFSKMPWIKP